MLAFLFNLVCPNCNLCSMLIQVERAARHSHINLPQTTNPNLQCHGQVKLSIMPIPWEDHILIASFTYGRMGLPSALSAYISTATAITRENLCHTVGISVQTLGLLTPFTRVCCKIYSTAAARASHAFPKPLYPWKRH